MDIYELLIEKFEKKLNCIKYTEDFDKLSINILTDNCMLLANDIILNEILDSVSDRDKIRLKIFEYDEENEEDEYVLARFSSGDNLDEFIKEMNLIDEEKFTFKIQLEIIKQKINGELSIYSLEKFIEYLEKLQFKSIIFKFNELLMDEVIIFRLQNENHEFNSTSIYFLTNDTIKHIDSNLIMNNKEKKIDRIRCNCKFIQTNEYRLIPEDFNLENCGNTKLKSLMNKIKIILSIISICDISNIKNSDEIEIIINGYKRINTEINYKDDFDSNLLQYFEIEKWIYSGENIEDKIGIARNVISISLSSNMMKFDQGLFASIKSAHSIYQKQNVKQYLEAKSKISEFHFDLMKKMSDLSKDIGKSLFNNIKAIGTFYGTVIIMNILSDKRLDNIFTKDITNLSLAVCAFSIVYMFITIFNIKNEVKIFEKQYKRVKSNYSEILNKTDIDNIFKNDEYFTEDRKFIFNRTISYSIVWISSIVILLILIYHLGYEYIIDFISGF